MFFTMKEVILFGRFEMYWDSGEKMFLNLNLRLCRVSLFGASTIADFTVYIFGASTIADFTVYIRVYITMHANRPSEAV